MTGLVTVEAPELAVLTLLQIATLILARRSISARKLLVFWMSVSTLSGSSTASQPTSKGLLAASSFSAQALLQSGVRFQRGLQQFLVGGVGQFLQFRNRQPSMLGCLCDLYEIHLVCDSIQNCVEREHCFLIRL